MNKGIIYGYKDILKNKIVYVGQIINLKARHYRHLRHDPTNKLLLEYEYPLSRAIRKYGKENYDLIILEENIKQEELNRREIYFIREYGTYEHGYNQNEGGQIGSYNLYEEEEIDIVIEMLRNNTSYKEISKTTGISLSHISNINSGNRCARDGINYPIRSIDQVGVYGRKFSKEQIGEITALLQGTTLSQSKIAQTFNVSNETIYHINHGRRYKQDDVVYPIRES